MPTPRALEVRGPGGQLPCVLYEVEAAAGSALVVPGGARANYRLGGTPARPDLHFTRALLVDFGLTVLEVWWDTDLAPEGEEGEAWLAGAAAAGALSASSAAPLRVAVARSWGTRALAKLVLAGGAPATTVWIAPLVRYPEVREALDACAPGACLVYGTDDELVDHAAVRELEAAGASVIAVQGGNHGHELPDPAASARALADMLESLRAFLEAAQVAQSN